MCVRRVPLARSDLEPGCDERGPGLGATQAVSWSWSQAHVELVITVRNGAVSHARAFQVARDH